MAWDKGMTVTGTAAACFNLISQNLNGHIKLDIFYRLFRLNRFRKLAPLPSSVQGIKPTLLGPLARSNLSPVDKS
jgi:hypothetical protein